jgi:hypothetical protein
MTTERFADGKEFASVLDALQRWRQVEHLTVEYPGFLQKAPATLRYEGDFESFLSLVDKLTPAFLYVQLDELNRDQLAQFAEELLDRRAAIETGIEDEPPDEIFSDEDDLDEEDEDLQREIDRFENSLPEGHGLGEPVELQAGFVRDGIFHFVDVRSEWYLQFIANELESVEAKEDEVRKLRANGIAELRSINFIDELLADKRALAVVSKEVLYDLAGKLAVERVPGLGSMPRWQLWSEIAKLVPDLLTRTSAKRAELEQEALSDLPVFAADFLADPIVLRAKTVKAREPLAKRYVEDRLGFRSAAVASQLARYKANDKWA